MALLIHPQGNFPLHDDWAYGRAVQSLLNTGSVRLPDWSAVSLAAQMFWGALFCLPLGFSFTALRLSTLALGLIGILVTYAIFLELGATRGTALFAGLCLAVNPLYLVLSYTFMTDVPFTTCSLLSLYFLVRAMRTGSNAELAVGLLFACVALLIRQNALAIFIAAGLAYLAKNGLRGRTLLLAAAPILLGVTIQLLFQEWMRFTGTTPAFYGLQVRRVLQICSQMSWRSVAPLTEALSVFLVYLGLFLFPFLIFLGARNLRKLFRSPVLTSITLCFIIFTGCFLRHRRMPLLPNFMYNLGLGPLALYDTETLGLPHVPGLGGHFWTGVTLVGLIGAAFLFQATLVAITSVLSRDTVEPLRKQRIVLVAGTAAVYISPLMVLWSDSVFDRYLILLVPLAALLVIQSCAMPELATTNFRLALAACIALILYAGFSVAGTHDYLSWNRVRWQAVNELMSKGHVSPAQIDGGFEFNGWYLYRRNSSKVESAAKKSWWWVQNDDFVIALGPVPGYTRLKSYVYSKWLPPGRSRLLILRRSAAADSRSASPRAATGGRSSDPIWPVRQGPAS